jgi:serine/threonine protein kinase
MIAVKRICIISVTNGVDQEMVKLLKREITVMKTVKSIYTVKFLGSEIIGSDFCIYMEYMDQGSI